MPDCVVIGSGAGGAAAAWRLCQHGLNVLLLEAGPRFDPASDYKLADADWERHNYPIKPGSQGAFSFGALGAVTDAHPDLRSWNSSSGIYTHSLEREIAGPGYSHVQGLGGTTLHFVGESHRMHPAALRLQSQFGAGADWPLAYADLEPYYALCEQVIGVAGPNEPAARWRSTPYPLPPHPLSPAAQRLKQVGQTAGMSWQANARAALSQPYDNRPACNYCGNCSRGCPIGDKGSADVTFIPKAEETGNLRIETGAQVIRLIEDKAGRIGAAEYIQNGKIYKVATPQLVLAAGAVQTPRLLLASASTNAPTGLANSSGQVGRNFMETLAWTSTGLLADLSNTFKGLPADAICWDYNAPDAIPGVIGGCRFNSGVQEIGFNGPVAYASRAVAGFGFALKKGVRESFGHAITVGAIGEALPNENSFIDLDPNQRDPYGMPLARIQAQLGEMEIRRLRFMAETSRRLLALAGADLVEETSTYDLFSSTHVFGTCRMGKAAAHAVVDATGRSFDHSNLYIADASVFPSSGGGESPSLTIHALAVRTADHLAGQTLLPASTPPRLAGEAR